VTQEPLCPRCGYEVQPPGLMSSDWRCDRHGSVAPLHPTANLSSAVVQQVAERAGVPVWLPWPLPNGWMVTGAVLAGDGRSPSAASALVCSGPGARGGPADLVFVSEEPGVGLGAGYAGLTGPDPGASMAAGSPSTRVDAAQHDTPLWEIPSPPDRSVYVGEADGRWLWAIAWPMEAVLLLHDDVRLVDLRDPGLSLDVPVGAMSPRWRPTGVSEGGDG